MLSSQLEKESELKFNQLLSNSEETFKSKIKSILNDLYKGSVEEGDFLDVICVEVINYVQNKRITAHDLRDDILYCVNRLDEYEIEEIKGIKNTFKHRIEEFLSELNLSKKVENDFIKEVIRLILTIQKNMGATNLRAFSRKHEFFEDFTTFKKQYIDVSSYLQQTLWREIVYFIQNKDFKEKDNNNLNHDILYCINKLDDEDIEKILNMEINHNLNATLDMDEFTTGQKVKRDLQTYAKSKASTLKFLSKFDHGISPDDHTQDIIEEVLRVNNIYNKSSGKNLSGEEDIDTNIKRYIETALNNKVNQIKDYWGSDIRRRVTSTHSHHFRRRNNLKKLIKKETCEKKIKEYNNEIEEINEKLRKDSHDYYSTVTPLVRTNESENREVDAQEIDLSTIEEYNFEDDYWEKDLILDLPPRLSRCVNIILGNYDEEFLKWLKLDGKKYKVDILDQHFKAAMDFCKVNKKELRANPVILQALSTCSNARGTIYKRDANIMVRSIATNKIHAARLDDTREDGSMIFTLVEAKKPRVIDTGFDKKWKFISEIND